MRARTLDIINPGFHVVNLIFTHFTIKFLELMMGLGPWNWKYGKGVISAKSVWELFIGVKKVCDKMWQKLQYKVLIMAKIALNKSYGGNNG